MSHTSNAILASFSVSAVLLGGALGCGSTSSDSSSGQTGGTGGGGTSGTGGLATGGTGGVVQQTGCRGTEGAHEIYSPDSTLFHDPYLLLQSDGDSCTAVVATKGHLGRAYSVTFTDQTVVLKPVDKPAKAGSEDLTTFHIWEWTEIRLDRDSNGLSGSGEMDVFYDWNEEDVWGSDSLKLSLELRPPAATDLSASGKALPWDSIRLVAFPPVPTLAPHLSGPSGEWTFKDVVEDGAVGIIAAEASFAGKWDDVRGKKLAFNSASGLSLLDGSAFAPASASAEVLDIGPAVASHDMPDMSTLAMLGWVGPYEQGACKTLGCVELNGCYLPGVAGQLDTTNKTQVVLSMRLAGPSLNTPTEHRIAVVAEDGTPLSPSTGGSFVAGQEAQDWVYDVAGHARIGFSIQAATSCHGWGDSLILDKVFTQ